MTRLIFLIAIFSLFVFIGPWATITSLNVLFGLNIPVTFSTWFATAWLHFVLASKVTTKN